MMRRLLPRLVLVVIVVSTALLGGCMTLRGPKADPSVAGDATLEVGTKALQSFIPQVATSFSDGVGVLGIKLPAKGSQENPLTALMQPVSASNWASSKVTDDPRRPSAAVNLGSIQVVVGGNPTSGNKPGSAQVPFVAVRTLEDGGAFQAHDVGQSIFGGKSAEIECVALTGDPEAEGTQFIMVGATTSSQNGELGNPNGTIPVAFTSPDGTTWEPTAELPLPEGVTGADAMSVAYASSDTAYPGVVVAGTGWAPDPKIGRRTVGIVWQSSDVGKTWEIISDNNFNEEGRELAAMFVAADNQTIVVGGVGDVPNEKLSPGASKQVAAVDWALGGDNEWTRMVDDLAPNRSSVTTALIARPGGGFLSATQVYDVGSAPSKAGLELTGNPVANAWSSVNGVDWTDQTPSIKDMESAAVINGICEVGGRAALFGVDNKSTSLAYIVESAKLK